MRAYRSAGQSFALAADGASLRVGDEIWRIEEDGLVGRQGQRLERLPGHIAWRAFIEGAPLAEGAGQIRRA